MFCYKYYDHNRSFGLLFILEIWKSQNKIQTNSILKKIDLIHVPIHISISRVRRKKWKQD